MAFFDYGKKEMDYLSGRDKRLGKLIDHYGFLERELFPDIFTGLVHSVVSQQISPGAARTIFDRLVEQVGPITPTRILCAPLEQLTCQGLSIRKAQYIHGLAESVLSEEINLRSLAEAEDDEVIRQLVKIRGVGPWTAQMILIFALERKDVLSPGDYGVGRGLAILYDKDEITPEQFKRYARRYSPFGTIAAFYLWELNQDTPNSKRSGRKRSSGA